MGRNLGQPGAQTGLGSAAFTGYGFSAKMDSLAQLLALNQQVAAKIKKGKPVTAPGQSAPYHRTAS